MVDVVAYFQVFFLESIQCLYCFLKGCLVKSESCCGD